MIFEEGPQSLEQLLDLRAAGHEGGPPDQAGPNLYLTYISNFSCAPDSFLLHYVRWMMGQKPYLVLEIDSHTADAGLDTRSRRSWTSSRATAAT